MRCRPKKYPGKWVSIHHDTRRVERGGRPTEHNLQKQFKTAILHAANLLPVGLGQVAKVRVATDRGAMRQRGKGIAGVSSLRWGSREVGYLGVATASTLRVQDQHGLGNVDHATGLFGNGMARVSSATATQIVDA